MLQYPAKIEADGDGFMVSFRDIPEALTGADTREEAEKMAADALLTAMDFYFEDGRAVPEASAPKDEEVLVSLPASVEAKILVLNEMVSQDVTQTELARKMGTTKQEVTRIVNLHHSTKIDTLALALHALGRRLQLTVA
ncbi:type II toxin-antitoxin system HicB family antitoxin [Achromobacter sp. NFACC18-2]|uniref:type II toxin-antitoxin system HicB family antitoxin n=1 Tax=Achromobacter sp. NFACC18-2 TaxID=1564112 RepID=UPI0008B08B62|nr:type II toxin-antitoxin system HicB family antitoxin [Achromobacter sp. NFACC18-2]SEK12106.1 antitoxin HicB [Achromobacter sp. NFACC18-2]